MYSEPDDGFLLLNDLPVDDQSEDLLGTSEVAGRLAELVHGSRSNTPFVLAIDGGWGTGKSTLMKQVSSALLKHNDVEVVWFNAWTASGVSALSGMLKIVLGRLDRGVVRRSFARLKNAGVLTGALRLGLTLMAGFFRVDRALDQLWERISVDAKAREEARTLVRTAVASWLARNGSPRQTLAVFIDDLDRCGEKTAIEICEVIKLYLDLPGVAFILGCDLGVLSRIPLPGTETPTHVRRYLEKIIQVNYQVPVPAEQVVNSMIAGYALRSHTWPLFTESLVQLIGRQSDGNPRRIKRLINSFVAEYQLDPQWRQFGAEGLMKAVVLQHFYPEYYQAIMHSTGDIVADMLNYRQARDWLRGQGQPAESSDTVHGVLGRWMIPQPQGDEPAGWLASLTQLDERVPPLWRSLVGNNDFLDLLQEFGDDVDRNRLQQRLRRRPLSTLPSSPELATDGQAQLDGLRLLWIDDNPADQELLINHLIADGAQVRTALDAAQAVRLIPAFRPNAVISDVTRDGREVGFDGLALVHASGYHGPVLFFTGHVSPERQERADAAGAQITTSINTVLGWLMGIARETQGTTVVGPGGLAR